MAEPDVLARVLGPVAEVQASNLATSGFSGSTHRRLAVRLADGGTRSLVLKRTRVADDWLSSQTGDRVGREGLLLSEPALNRVWDAFACPYLAWSSSDGDVGLLMEDLTPYLLPDVREPIGEEQEERLLGALAAMHTAFWESPTLSLPWLARPDQLFGLLNAATLETMAERGFPHAVLGRAHAGWSAAFRRLPERVSALLREPPESLAARGTHLPRTLTHGDFKVANFALMPDGRVAAFDWAVMGAGPVATELGWHLAVNATRIPGPKEDSIARYRKALESALGHALDGAFWKDTVENAVLAGGAMLLWSKALALDSGAARARGEWDWWVERLAALCSSSG